MEKLKEPSVPQMFIQVAQNGTRSRRYQINKNEILMGRSPQADVVLEGEQVSRTHARLTHANGRWRLTDCNSANGVYLDRGGRGAPFLARGDVVVNGDQLYIGHYQLSITTVEESAPAVEEAVPDSVGFSVREPSEKTVLVNRGLLKEELRNFMDNTPPPLVPARS